MENIIKLGMFNYINPAHTIKPYSNDDVISNLKFIGKVRDGDKINTANLTIQPKGIITKFSRTFWNQDNHNNTFTFIVNTITQSMNILNINLNLYREDNNKLNLNICRNIITDIENAIIGINNLRKTYYIYSMFCCKLEVLVQEIVAKLSPIKEKLKIISEEEKMNQISEKEKTNTFSQMEKISQVSHMEKLNIKD